MNKRRLTVKLTTLEESLARFKDVWERAEQGEKFDTPVEVLGFENAATLMKTLSPKRLELLKELHLLGKTSIKALAKHLERDYSNVHQDVKSLYKIGLILEDSTGKYYVPWDSIVTEFSLCEDKKEHHEYRSHYYHGNSIEHAHHAHTAHR